MGETQEERFKKALLLLKPKSENPVNIPNRKQDFAEAGKLLNQLAEENFAPAQERLGWHLQLGTFAFAKGKEVSLTDKENQRKAFVWFQKAADQNYSPAQKQLGLAYTHGDGVEKNPTLGLSWLLKAAAQKNRDAYFFLGQYYLHGWGNEKDPEKAYGWYVLAADQNHPNAFAVLGSLFRKGLGVQKDLIQAKNYYLKALEGNKTSATATQHIKKILNEIDKEAGPLP